MSIADIKAEVAQDYRDTREELDHAANQEMKNEEDIFPRTLSGHQPRFLKASEEIGKHLREASRLRGLANRVHEQGNLCDVAQRHYEDRANKLFKQAGTNEDQILAWMKTEECYAAVIGKQLLIDAEALVNCRDLLVLNLEELRPGSALGYFDF